METNTTNYLIEFLNHRKPVSISLRKEDFKAHVISLIIDGSTIQDHLTQEEISEMAEKEIYGMVSGKIKIPSSYGIIKIFNLI
jgi:hypothetical protein